MSTNLNDRALCHTAYTAIEYAYVLDVLSLSLSLSPLHTLSHSCKLLLLKDV